jgi:carbonic anhydrase/acetyltransferase-like protein (isoleucine patch superfamily)
MIIGCNGKYPKIGKNVFIAPTACVIGDVEIKDGSSIWYGAVLRGDSARVTVGCETNIQDNCTVHTDENCPTIIGNRVTIGHNAVVHGCTIEDACLIGINAVVLNHAVIHTGSIVAAGSLVRETQQVGPCHLVAGIPASTRKTLSKQDAPLIGEGVASYAKLAEAHRLANAKTPADPPDQGGHP